MNNNIFLSFEDIQNVINNAKHYTIINILSENQQQCLIQNTMLIDLEVKTINQWVQLGKAHEHAIILYGKNSDDLSSLEKKRRELRVLGFLDVYIYLGGLFEWLLLQDIYGTELFATTSQVIDILSLRPLTKLTL